MSSRTFSSRRAADAWHFHIVKVVFFREGYGATPVKSTVSSDVFVS